MIGEIGNFKMKKLLLILLCLPFIGFGQCISGDCKNGQGTFTWAITNNYGGWLNGNKYAGEWKDGERNGQGTFTWADGGEYVGEWKDGKRIGEGTYTYADNIIGLGFIQKPIGDTMIMNLGFVQRKEITNFQIITDVYDGSPAEKQGLLVDDIILSINDKSFDEWKKEEKILRNAKIGKSIIGYQHKFLIERKGKIQKLKIANGNVSKLYSNNIMSYTGEWKDNKPNGLGTTVYFNGEVEKGVYKDWKLIESLKIEDRIKKIVEQKVNDWQKKGEFEKTSEYLVRINEINRNAKIEELQKEALSQLKQEYISSIDFSYIKLGEYDADNETFLLKDSKLGDLVISVPINEAKEFKLSFQQASPYSSITYENAKCRIIDNEFVLSSVAICRYKSYRKRPSDKTHTYTYNLSNSQDYVLTEIDYEFSSIEIDDITSVNKTKSSNISTNKLKVGTSSVNINIPTNKKVNNRYALIIGNEDYQSKQRGLSDEQNVDYAVKDASIFQEYALKTLGVKEDNMFFLTDATSIEMNRKIKLVSKIIKKLGNKAELIVYYAGHGYPDETTKVPYLIPVDVPASDLSYAIKLDDFYKDLSATGAKSITVFLDACFTGGGRESGLMASRGVKVKPKEGSLNGNLVVFSASSGNQSALPYHDEGHGMFTYYLLKKLQESKGKVTMGELADYISNEVSIQSLKTNEKEQDPKVNTSSKVINDWRNWKF